MKDRRIHIQTVVIRMAAEDRDVDALDRLNERLKTYFTEELEQENDVDARYDGVALTVESTHRDIDLSAEEVDALVRAGELLEPLDDLGISLFPPRGSGLLN